MNMWIKAVLLVLLLAIPMPSEAAIISRPVVDVLIDAGHGGVDSGTSHAGVMEKDINLQMAKILYSELEKSGYRVILNRHGDYALSDENRWLKNTSRHIRDLAQRKHLAEEVSPRIMISLHTNWSSSAAQRGPIVLYQQNNQSYFLATIVQHRLNELYRTKEKPVKGRTYYMLKHAICPTLIVEMGFISNAQDMRMMTKPQLQKKLVQAIREAIDEYFVLTDFL